MRSMIYRVHPSVHKMDNRYLIRLGVAFATEFECNGDPHFGDVRVLFSSNRTRD